MASEKRLVYAKEVEEIFNYEVQMGETDLFDAFDSAIEKATTVDAVEVVHGRWLDVALRFTQVKEKCSVCGGIVYAHGFNYCPKCGAKMDGASDG